jgi:NNP family nitrate/nitrite transporter-like MFS transporter
MTQIIDPSQTDVAAPPSAGSSVVLTSRPGRWLDGWNPEDTAFWNSAGRAIARRNLGW